MMTHNKPNDQPKFEPDEDINNLLRFCLKYLEIFVKTHNGMKIKPEDNVILLSTFMIRLAENLRGVVHTAIAGAPINGYIILRAMSETYILMFKCMDDPSFYKVYSNKYLIDEINKLTRMKFDPKKFDSFSDIDRKINGLKEQIVVGKKGYKSREFFKELNKENVYERIYLEGSSHIHSDVNTIDRYLVRTGDSISIGTNHNLERDIIFTCSGASDLFIDAYKKYTTYIGFPFANFSNFEAECNEIRVPLDKRYFGG